MGIQACSIISSLGRRPLGRWLVFALVFGFSLPVWARHVVRHHKARTHVSRHYVRHVVRRRAPVRYKRRVIRKRHVVRRYGRGHYRHVRYIRRRRTPHWRRRVSISSNRATQIQQALVKAGYLTQASGYWDEATRLALKRYQADHHWQNRVVPDSRALIALGLGPTPTLAVLSGPGSQALPVETVAASNAPAADAALQSNAQPASGGN